jgi:hypothetical protein
MLRGCLLAAPYAHVLAEILAVPPRPVFGDSAIQPAINERDETNSLLSSPGESCSSPS